MRDNTFDLHSTIFILKLLLIFFISVLPCPFTFYYIYIKTYDVILSLQLHGVNLHSTIFILKLISSFSPSCVVTIYILLYLY